MFSNAKSGYLLLVGALLLAGAPWLFGASALPVERVYLVSGGKQHPFDVEVAATPAAWRTGLQGRAYLAPNAGMLFDFGEERPAAMWMRDTPLSLDMLFIDRRGVIVRIAAETEPFSDTLIHSPGPVRAVLELRGGRAAELGVRVGDRVLHALFPATDAAP